MRGRWTALLTFLCLAAFVWLEAHTADGAQPKKSSKPTNEKTAGLHVRGEVRAPVTLEEFGDFECGPCAELFGMIREVESEAGATARLVFRHFPLNIHPHAIAAASAAEAAGFQGRFWEMHDLLYQEQNVWSQSNDPQAIFADYAKRLGLDLGRFGKDCKSRRAKARIASDQAEARKRGVAGTPTLFINGWKVPRYSYSIGGLLSRIRMLSSDSGTAVVR